MIPQISGFEAAASEDQYMPRNVGQSCNDLLAGISACSAEASPSITQQGPSPAMQSDDTSTTLPQAHRVTVLTGDSDSEVSMNRCVDTLKVPEHGRASSASDSPHTGQPGGRWWSRIRPCSSTGWQGSGSQPARLSMWWAPARSPLGRPLSSSWTDVLDAACFALQLLHKG